MASRWTIEGNSFYHKNPVNFSFAGGIVGIDISSGSYSNETIIRGNFIGGTEKFAKGIRWIQSGNFSHYFWGIRASFFYSYSNICERNTIKNISISTNSPFQSGGINFLLCDGVSNTIGDSLSD